MVFVNRKWFSHALDTAGESPKAVFITIKPLGLTEAEQPIGRDNRQAVEGVEFAKQTCGRALSIPAKTGLN
jgi:hypothetical protein